MTILTTTTAANRRRPASCTSSTGSARNRPTDRHNEWADIARWRKAERERLIAARLAIPADTRAVNGRRRSPRDSTRSIGDVCGPHGQPLLAVSRRARPAAVDGLCHRARRHDRPAGRHRKGAAAGLPRLQARRPPGKGRLEHPDPRRGRAGHPRYRDRAAGRRRSAKLPAGLWRRLLRPHAGLAAAKAAGHRRRLRDAAHRDHPSATARHPDGPDRDVSELKPAPASSPSPCGR